jgi:hypothetical protein
LSGSFLAFTQSAVTKINTQVNIHACGVGTKVHVHIHVGAKRMFRGFSTHVREEIITLSTSPHHSGVQRLSGTSWSRGVTTYFHARIYDADRPVTEVKTKVELSEVL